MILKNQKRFVELLDFDLETGERDSYVHSGSEIKDSSGFFCRVNQQLFGLGVQWGKVFLILDGKAIEATADINTKIENRAGYRVFSASNERGSILEIVYKAETPLFYPTYTEEDEDVDILLWIHNVLSDPERVQIFQECNDA
jgi:hypothetical protein